MRTTMKIEARVAQGVAADGALDELRLTRQKGLATADAHGRYFDAVDRGNCFFACLTSPCTWGTALTATAVTYTLYNPSGSGKNLVLLETTATVITQTAAGSVVYAVNDIPGQVIPVTTTALTIRNCKLGGGASSVARAYSAATLPAAPIAVRNFFSVAATAATGLSPVILTDEVAGRIILPPNTAVTLQGITIAGTGFVSMLWEECTP